jgi:SNF2 family DNA or RNA helicase
MIHHHHHHHHHHAAAAGGGSSASSLQLRDEVVSIPSPKVISLIESLQSMHAEDDKNLKAVVFSQFTSFLDVISHHLDQQGIVHSRLDGGMSMKRRTTELNTWRKNNSQESSTSVLLISTKAGGQGLNLTQGSRVYLMDPVWNSASENQAMDRCHRLGQTRRVTVTRYVMESSLEIRILELQERKATLSKGALVKLSQAELQAARRSQMKTLFDL